MTPRGPARAGRLPSLTGLRFWAALLVVLYHLTRQVGELPFVSPLVMYGRSGVTFFFVLSGVVLAWTYDRRPVPAGVFYRRRFARVWPLHAVTTAVSLAVYALIGAALPVTAALWSLPLLHAWLPGMTSGGNPASWSLSDEAWFYLLFPALFALLAGRGRRTWSLAGAVAFASAAALWLLSSGIESTTLRVWLLDYLPLSRTGQFAIGVVVGLALSRGWRPPVPLWVATAGVLLWHVILVAWSSWVPDSQWYGPYSASQVFSAPLFAMLIAAAAQRDIEGRPTGVAGPRMQRLGDWSFAWYLVHEIGIRLLVHFAGRSPSPWATSLRWLLLIAGTLAVSGLLYTLVERPAERWLRGSERVGRPAGETAGVTAV